MNSNKTKIIATLGPSSTALTKLKSLIQAGVNVFRVNFSHASHAEVLETVSNIREISASTNTHVAILGDLQGPKIRLGTVEENSKVKKGDLKELLVRMDIIPASIALAQAAKESGWGTSRFALEGNAIFGQWTWSGQGIAPLDRASNKNHKILKFPILRASVKAYKNNLNTHKSYSKFREKRSQLRAKNKKISGLELTEMLNNYAQTGAEYTKILNQIIRQNRLTDFEPVSLVNSVKNIELSS